MAEPRKRAPRKRAPAAAARQAPAEETPEQPEGLRPVQIGQREDKPAELITLFSIDDVDYKIPARPDPQRGLRFLRQSRDPKVGFAAAVDNLALDLIGEANLRALEESPKTTREDLAQVFSVVRKLILGGPTVMDEAARSGNS